MSQNNSAQNSEQQIKIQKLHVLFQQLCFSYGSLALTKENVNQDQGYQLNAGQIRTRLPYFSIMS